MNIINDIISIVIQLLIAVLVVVIPKYLIPAMKDYLENSRMNEFVKEIESLIDAAEQIYKLQEKSGDLKKAHVKKTADIWLSEKNWPDKLKETCYALLNNFIEAGVYEMNLEKEYLKKAE